MADRSLTIVLVHGAFADHHAFDGVRPLLEARGHQVITPDLPGHGERGSTEPLTLDSYVAAIAEVVANAPTPVVLVGHSMAGMVVAQVAEQWPERIAQVVFVAAYLPQSGQSLQGLAETDAASLVGQNLIFAPDYSTVTIRPERLAEAICADVPPQTQQLIIASQRPEPLAPFQGVVTLTAERFGTVKKAYIRTTEDRAVTPELQGRMLAGYPSMPVTDLATSHLPFVARPEAFVEALEASIRDAR